MPEPIKVLAGVLLHELDLKPEQVLLYNQKFNIPKDDRVYVSVGIIGAKEFGAKTGYEPDPVTGDLVEVQSVNRQTMASIHIFSRGDAARVRNWEIVAALKSTYSQQQQEKVSMSFGSLPTSMADISGQDGTAILNRYALTFMVLSVYTKRKPVQYFNTFAQPRIYTSA